ncbi:MAG TPA: hypothetical protein VMH83_02180, partial [Candidatus Acidoferrum sp.]|nr:hypothetical protein [Candidatus Acidoferrum sp.]
KYQELSVTKDKKSVIFYGEYTYNRGREGWVKMQVTQVKNEISVDCIEFWDFRGQCRPFGRSPSQAIMAGVMVEVAREALTAPVGSSNNSGVAQGCREGGYACLGDHYDADGHVVDSSGNIHP